MRLYTLAFAGILAGLLLWPAPASAQLGVEEEPPGNGAGVRFGEVGKQRYRVGVIIRAARGPVTGMTAAIPVPSDWPEQSVERVEEEVTDNVARVTYRKLDGGVERMIVSIPRLQGGETAKAIAVYEVRRRAILPPENPAALELPKKIDLTVRKNYLGKSPFIEVFHEEIRKAAREAIRDHADEPAYDQVRAIWDFVREKVKLKNMALKGALAALRDGDGDCEERTSLFVAMCRSNGIPARSVWVPGHCYPEFMLQDSEGNNIWIPCESSEADEFGEISSFRPVLQKGDNFYVPETRKRQRYVAEVVKARGINVGRPPDIQYLREELPAE